MSQLVLVLHWGSPILIWPKMGNYVPMINDVIIFMYLLWNMILENWYKVEKSNWLNKILCDGVNFNVSDAGLKKSRNQWQMLK